MNSSGIPREPAPRHDEIGVQIVEEVARQKDTVPEQLPVLSAVIDPDGLGDFVRSAEDTALVSFRYAGFRIRVRGTGYVELTRIDG